MDTKAFYKLSYGVFLLSTKSAEKLNACITNTCIQVASNPTRVAISCINSNYTCELLKESGKFTLSILDNTCNFETIRHFGLQSGRNIDKFSSFAHEIDAQGLPYITQSTCAVLHCDVMQSVDLTSHTVFIAEVKDAQILSSSEPLTYSDYQNHIKPQTKKPTSDRKPIAWRCKVCGYVHKSEVLPSDFLCPLCGHASEDFEPVYGD